MSILFLPLLDESWAQESSNTDPFPTTYDSGISLMNIGEIDKKAGTYWMDFFFYMESDSVDFTQDIPEIVFMNARDIEIDEPHVTPNYFEIRVKGDFATKLDFEKFPFEKHDLVIEIEPKLPHDTSKFVFRENPENSIDSEMKISSNLKMFDSDAKTTSHTYFDGLEFSRIVVTYTVGPEPFGSAFKTFLPVSIIVGISLIIFFIPGHYTPRIYLTAPLLLAAVYWHQSSLAHLPALGYVTSFDKLMILYYLLFVNSILSLAIQMRVSEKDKNDIRVKKYNKIFTFSTIGLILYALVRILTNEDTWSV